MSGKRLPGGICGVLAAALVLWALFLRPLPAHFGSAIPHSSRTAPGASRVETLRPGDHLQLLYHFQLVGQMVSGRIQPFANPYEFNLGEDVRRIDPYYVPFSLVFAASRPLFGNAAAWNLAQLASVLVGAWFLFLLARRWSGEGPDAALLAAAAALAATCVPYRWETLAGGSPTGFGMAWIPGVALGVDIAIRDRRASGGLLAGVLLLLCYTTDLHCFLFALLALPLWAVLSWLGRPADRLLPDRAETRGVVVALLPLAGFVALSGGIAFALRRLYAATDAAGGRTIADLRSPFPEGLIDPASPTFMAAQVFLGWGFAALFAIAAVCAVRRLVRSSGPARRRAAAALLVCAVLVFSVLLALANRGPWDGLAVRAARKLVPPFRMVRQPIKVFCLLPTLLAPLLAWVLGERAARPSETGKEPVSPPPCDSPRRVLLRRIAPPALVLLLAAIPAGRSLRTGLCRLPAEPSAAYRAAVADAAPRTARALILPLWPGDSAWSSLYQFHAAESGLRMLNGYAAVKTDDYLDNVFRRFETVACGDLTDDQLAALDRLGVTCVILHEDAFPEKVSPCAVGTTLRRLLAHPRLRLIRKDGPVWAFAIQPPPAPGPRPAAPLPDPAVVDSSARAWHYPGEGCAPSALGRPFRVPIHRPPEWMGRDFRWHIYNADGSSESRPVPPPDGSGTSTIRLLGDEAVRDIVYAAVPMLYPDAGSPVRLRACDLFHPAGWSVALADGKALAGPVILPEDAPAGLAVHGPNLMLCAQPTGTYRFACRGENLGALDLVVVYGDAVTAPRPATESVELPVSGRPERLRAELHLRAEPGRGPVTVEAIDVAWVPAIPKGPAP